eukprot:jgi/Tetstr1/448589/TSEL_035838.t1
MWRLLGQDAAHALLRRFPNEVPTPYPDLNAPGLLEVILPPEDMDVADQRQVKPYDGEKEGKVDPWKLWHWVRSALETWVGKKQRQMKRKALFAALLESRRAFVAGAEKAGELAPGFWSWLVIALLFTPADAPAQITYIDGQAPNLQAILACTCHCRPTEVYRGPEVSFTDAVKHIRYPVVARERISLIVSAFAI